MMTNEMIMLDRLELARDMSTYNDCAIYAFSNGENIKIVAKRDWFDEARNRLTSQGYWVAAIFENGHVVEA